MHETPWRPEQTRSKRSKLSKLDKLRQIFGTAAHWARAIWPPGDASAVLKRGSRAGDAGPFDAAARRPYPAATALTTAELNARQSVLVAKADSTYAVAKEKCDDMSGSAKTTCMSDAKAMHTGVKADAPAPMKTTAVAKPAKEVAVATPAKKETPGEYVDDAVITTKVKAAVFETSTLKSSQINVETYKGTVQLTGFVSSSADIAKAVEVAKGVKGVKSVKNDMILRPATK